MIFFTQSKKLIWGLNTIGTVSRTNAIDFFEEAATCFLMFLLSKKLSTKIDLRAEILEPCLTRMQLTFLKKQQRAFLCFYPHRCDAQRRAKRTLSSTMFWVSRGGAAEPSSVGVALLCEAHLRVYEFLTFFWKSDWKSNNICLVNSHNKSELWWLVKINQNATNKEWNEI